MTTARITFGLAASLLFASLGPATPSAAIHDGTDPIAAQSLGVAAFGKSATTTRQDFIEVPNVAPAGDRLVLVWVVHRASKEAEVQQISSIDGLGLDWTKHFHSVEHNLTRFALFSAVTDATPPDPGTLRIEFDSGSERTNVIVLEVAGSDLSSGAESAFTNMVVQEGFNNTTSRTHYLESFIDPDHNATLAFHLVGKGQEIVVEDGLTRVAEASNNTSLSSAAAFRSDEEVTPTFSWSDVASNGGLAMELRAPGTTPERQIVRRNLTQGFTTAALSATTAPIDPSPNRLSVAFVANTRSGGANMPSLSGPGNTTWSSVGTSAFASTSSPGRRITALVAKASPGPDGPVTISFSKAQDEAAWILFELSGVELGEDAVGAIRQVDRVAADAAPSLEVPLRGFGSPSNATLAAMAFGVSGPAPDDDFAPEPGYALAMGTDTRIPVGVGGLRIWSEWRASPESSPSGTLDVPTDAAMLGLEVRAAGVAQTPMVTGVTPDSVPSSGGAPVTIHGTDLLGASSVRFGDLEATSFTVVSSTRIDAVAPPQAPARVSVRVTTGGGVSEDTASDDFTVVPSVSIADADVSEAAGAASFVASLSEPAPFDVTVSHATSDGEATSPADYQQVTGTTTFVSGDAEETISVPVVNDALDEPDESFVLRISSPVNAAIADAAAIGRILDDDEPPAISIADAAALEDAGSVAVPLSLSAKSGRDVEVTVRSADGSATAGSDYSAVSTSITIPAGALSRDVAVPLLDDEIAEPQEELSLTLSSPTNATLGDSAATVTIHDDEGTPALRIDDVSVVEGDPGTPNAVFTISMTPRSASDVTVAFATVDGTATSGSDYTATSGVATIPAGSAGTQVAVPVTDDGIDEPDETFFVDLSNPSGATIADGRGQGTIADEDPPALSISDVTVTEGNANTVDAWFTVTLSSSPTSAVSVDYATSNGTATSGSDYVAKSGALSLAAGDTSKQLRVQVKGDTIDELDEDFFLDLSNASGATIADGRGVGTIVDDDPPALRISDVTVPEGNGDSVPATFAVSLSSLASEPVTVDYATADGSANSGSDYTAVPTSTLTIPAGESSGQITVDVLGDTDDEPDETFLVDLSNPSGATIADGQGQGTILDDDDPQPPTLSISDVRVPEGNTGTIDAWFTVTLSDPSPSGVTVSFATSDDSATAGSDYLAKSGSLALPAGQTSVQFRIRVLGDAAVEPDEDFFVDLSNPTNATLADPRGVGTIVNDDEPPPPPPPTLSIGDVTVAEGNGDSVPATFAVSLSSLASEPVTVDYATADGSAVAGSDYTALPTTTLTIPAGQSSGQITVDVLGDTLDEPDEDFFVDLSNPSGATIADGRGVGTIVDDDEAPPPLPTLSIGDASVTEGTIGEKTTMRFTVTLSSPQPTDVTFSYASVDGTATASSGDYNAVDSDDGRVVAGATSMTVRVVVRGDTLDEPDETFFVDLSNPQGATISDGRGEGTIIDDDDP